MYPVFHAFFRDDKSHIPFSCALQVKKWSYFISIVFHLTRIEIQTERNKRLEFNERLTDNTNQHFCWFQKREKRIMDAQVFNT